MIENLFREHIIKNKNEYYSNKYPSVLIIEPREFKDSRGYFFESFSQWEFDEKVTPILWHSIHSCKTKNQCRHTALSVNH